MQCPECGTEMIEQRVVSEQKILRGKKVEIGYTEFECPNCGARYVDAKSLDEAWRKVMEG